MSTTETTVNFEASPGIMYKLGSIEAELRSINEKLDKKERAQDEDISKLQTEVAQLKHNEALRLGAAAAVSFIIGILVKVIQWPNLNL